MNLVDMRLMPSFQEQESSDCDQQWWFSSVTLISEIRIIFYILFCFVPNGQSSNGFLNFLSSHSCPSLFCVCVPVPSAWNLKGAVIPLRKTWPSPNWQGPHPWVTWHHFPHCPQTLSWSVNTKKRAFVKRYLLSLLQKKNRNRHPFRFYTYLFWPVFTYHFFSK